MHKAHKAQDDVELNKVVDRLYDAILAGERRAPDLSRMSQIFAAEACITCITPAGTDYLDVPAFQAMTRELAGDGAAGGFFEYEVARRVDRIGPIAHVWSVYEVKRHRDASESMGRGVTSIQLARENGEWRVVSLSWDDAALERSELRAPRAGEARGARGDGVPGLVFSYN